jgi:hypothetical protein
MLNFTEQTGSGALIVVWSFLLSYSLIGSGTLTKTGAIPSNKEGMVMVIPDKDNLPKGRLVIVKDETRPTVPLPRSLAER